MPPLGPSWKLALWWGDIGMGEAYLAESLGGGWLGTAHNCVQYTCNVTVGIIKDLI